MFVTFKILQKTWRILACPISNTNADDSCRSNLKKLKHPKLLNLLVVSKKYQVNLKIPFYTKHHLGVYLAQLLRNSLRDKED